MRAELDKFDALKGQNISAQGKRSAALGCGPKMVPSLFFQSGLARCAKPDWKKREVGCAVAFTQGDGSACASLRRALPWADMLLPFQGVGPRGRKANKSLETMRVPQFRRSL